MGFSGEPLPESKDATARDAGSGGRPLVFITGYYGFGNTGDDAILAAMLHDLRELRPDLRAVVTSNAPQETESTHRVDAIYWQDVQAISEAVRAAQLVLVGGGGLFQEHWGIDPDALLTPNHWGIGFYAGPAVLASIEERPLMIYGVGVGPISSDHGRSYVRAACEAASAITVRDDDSRALLEEIGVPGSKIEVTADPAFTLEPAPVDPGLEALGGDWVVGVALRNWNLGVAPSFWEGQVAAGLDLFLSRQGGRALFVPLQHSSRDIEDDAAVAERIRRRMRLGDRTSVLAGVRSPAEIAGVLGACDLVLGMRLHSLIFAALGSVPVAALAYDSKVARQMEQLGLGELTLAMGDVEAEAIAGLLERTFSRRDELRARLGEARDTLRRSARRNAEVAAGLLGSASAPQDTVTPIQKQIVGRLLRGQLRQVDGLSTALKERDRRAEALSSELEKTNSILEALSMEVGTLRSTLGSSEKEVHRLQGDLARIFQSRLWRSGILYAKIRNLLRRIVRPQEWRPVRQSPPPQASGGDEGLAAPPEGTPIARPSAFDIVCFPIIDWGFRFQRPQQILSRFTAAGHRVFYLSLRFRPMHEPYELLPLAENVYEVSLRGPALNVYTDPLTQEHVDALFSSLDALRRDVSLGAAAAIVQLPFWGPLAERAWREFAWPVVYDCMDHHAGFPNTGPAMLAQEGKLLEGARLVLASSAELFEDCRRHGDKVLLLPNACDYEHFARVALTRRRERPVIGYYGAIEDWFDSDLVADLAERRPDWDFVLVGSTVTADVSRLVKLRNVSLPGEQPYQDLPGWLERFDVLILPFKRTPLTEATNPVKAYEILAAGKPLVSVPLPEVAALAPLIGLAGSPEEFEAQISSALAEDDTALVEKRRVFARENTWQKRFEALSPRLREAFPRVSVVVVTFNNLALNRQCLDSLFERTEWPNLDVIVVDNGSTDGTPEFLRGACERFPNLRVILNETNRGFPTAANQGLAVAHGEYLVLLNNDTVLTRGALSTLVRHLHADHSIGLIGPVTNAVANEAKVDVGYEDTEAMPAWAARYVRDHDDDVSPIPMLAMFCVALRRNVFVKVGALDERFGVGMFEDDDYNRRVREHGYEILCARDAFVHHWQRASFRLLGDAEYRRIFEENKRKYEAKWGESWGREGSGVRRPPVKDGRDTQLGEVSQRVLESMGAVVFLPSIGWDIHLFQRPHHLARTFAARGQVVVFDCSNAHDVVEGFREVETNIFLFRGPQELLHRLPNPILWTFPYNFHLKDGFPPGTSTVYDWIDDLSIFPYQRELLETNHQRGLEEATVVASVARRLHEQATLLRPDALYLPNGVEYERFADPGVAPAQDPKLQRINGNGKPIAGYYGGLAEWFDSGLLDQVVELRRDWNFLLIGPVYDQRIRLTGLLRRPNLAWIGPRDYGLLPGYLRLFDVATIPFRINEITLSVSPLKLYEYFAGGKPVVCTALPECEAFSEVHAVRTAEEFSAALDEARAEGKDEGFRERLRGLARANSWSTRVDAVLARLESVRRQSPGTRIS